MFKRTLALAAAAALFAASAAQAHRHARFHENSSPAAFTLADARATAQHYEAWMFRKGGPIPAAGACRFTRVNAAKCSITLVAPLVVGQVGTSTVQWTDVVTPDSRCHAWFMPDWCYRGLTVSEF